jgi:hypothetical protein
VIEMEVCTGPKRMSRMPDRKQGFDPLSSLFEVPEPAIDGADGLSDSAGGSGLGRVTTDLIQRETGAMLAEDAPTEKAQLPPSAENVDPVAIAKEVGRAAAAKATESVAVEARRNHAEREAVEEALMATLAQRAADGPSLGPSSVLNALPRPEADEAPAPRYGVKRSRTEAMAARARPPMTALEAARVAVKREEKRRKDKELVVNREQQQELSDRIQEMVPRMLPNAGAIYVANALRVRQRSLLQALWRSHRARFLADGQLERAVGAAAVLHALDSVSEEGLVVAHVVTDASDYLLWLDLDQDTVLAAFSDARAYFAGQP